MLSRGARVDQCLNSADELLKLEAASHPRRLKAFLSPLGFRKDSRFQRFLYCPPQLVLAFGFDSVLSRRRRARRNLRH